MGARSGTPARRRVRSPCRFGSRIPAGLAIEVRWTVALLVVRVSLPGTSRGVISRVKRLTKTERLRKSLFTAATGRRAVEHPPQSGFHWRRGFALSVVNVTGHLLTPRRWGTRVPRGCLSMTKDASFKKVVRRHAGETGQRYTEALTDLEGLGARMHHEPVAERLLAHLRDRYGIDPVAATKLSVHKTYVFRIDRDDGSPWVARAFPPARPRAGVEGDAAILRFLERQDYPAERLAVDDAVSDVDGSAVLVTRFVEGARLPDGAAKFAMMGELLGRLHALPYDETAARPGGASGEDPSREGTPRQDLLAALSFLDAVDTKVAAAERERFEQLRDQVRSADDGHGARATRVSPDRTAARAWSRPGRARRSPRDLTVRRATSGCRRSRPGCCAPPPRIWRRIVGPAIDGPHQGGQCHSEHTLTITRASVAHPGDRRWQLRRPTRRRPSTSCWSTQEPGRCDAGCPATSASSSSPAWPASP